MGKQLDDIMAIEGLAQVWEDTVACIEQKSSQEELLALAAEKKILKRIEELELEDLIKLSFESAKFAIERVSFKRRLKLLEDVDKFLLSLYKSTEAYGEQSFGQAMQPKIFEQIMGRIKHLEILQTWLFGIM